MLVLLKKVTIKTFISSATNNFVSVKVKPKAPHDTFCTNKCTHFYFDCAENN